MKEENKLTEIDYFKNLPQYLKDALRGKWVRCRSIDGLKDSIAALEKLFNFEFSNYGIILETLKAPNDTYYWLSLDKGLFSRAIKQHVNQPDEADIMDLNEFFVIVEKYQLSNVFVPVNRNSKLIKKGINELVKAGAFQRRDTLPTDDYYKNADYLIINEDRVIIPASIDNPCLTILLKKLTTEISLKRDADIVISFISEAERVLIFEIIKTYFRNDQAAVVDCAVEIFFEVTVVERPSLEIKHSTLTVDEFVSELLKSPSVNSKLLVNMYETAQTFGPISMPRLNKKRENNLDFYYRGSKGDYLLIQSKFKEAMSNVRIVETCKDSSRLYFIKDGQTCSIVDSSTGGWLMKRKYEERNPHEGSDIIKLSYEEICEKFNIPVGKLRIGKK